MRLCSLGPSRCHLPPELRLQRLVEERQGLEALDPAQPRLDVEERGGQPAVFLLRGAPVRDLPGPLADERVDGFEAVRGLQADPQGPKDPEPVQRERLLEPLVEALHGRCIHEAQFLAHPEERRLRLGVARP